jgi:pyruvate dehydrogenase E2 component (dihydrolipoamide acetyltransferase)
MIREIRIPEIGENIESGEVVKVLVSTGDAVELDQPIIELETDKAIVEIPSPAKGRITEITVSAGDTVKIGHVIARIETEEEEVTTPVTTPDTPSVETEAVSTVEEMLPGEPEDGEPTTPGSDTGDAAAPASPSVRRLARQLGVDINSVTGTGPVGRISREDVKEYVKKRISSTGRPSTSPEGAVKPLPDLSRWGSIEREPLSKVRSVITDNTSYAWQTIPHVTQFDEADITELDEFRKEYGKEAEAAGGKLTVTVILLKVIASALAHFPRFNASLDTQNGEIIYRKYFHIGVAVDTDHGLVVPVLKDVDKKSINELAVQLTNLAERARTRKISLAELEGGTFTVSNQGGIGGTAFTPIIFWPQVAILGVSRSSMRPVYSNGICEPRLILPLSLSYDHRIIDGADAARFLSWVAETLRKPLLMQL